MTDHALERLRERAPTVDAEQALAFLCQLVTHENPVFETVTGEAVFRARLPFGPVVFPVVASSGAIKTVLSEGMDVETPTGRVTLEDMSPGLQTISDFAYHADPCPTPSLSSGLARKVLKSPAHAWFASPRLNPDHEPENKEAFDVGTVAHELVLGTGPGWKVYPEDVLGSGGAVNTNAAKAFAAETREAGCVPIKAAQEANLLAMRDKCLTILERIGIQLNPDNSERAAFVVRDGVWCRCKVDNAEDAPMAPLYDFKTTTDASPWAIEREVVRRRLDVQAQHYREVWQAATGEAHQRPFRFIFQEKEPPYELQVVELKDHDLGYAAERLQRARDVWRMCLERDQWPGYRRELMRLELPTWETERWIEERDVIDMHQKQYGQDILWQAHEAQSPLN